MEVQFHSTNLILNTTIENCFVNESRGFDGFVAIFFNMQNRLININNCYFKNSYAFFEGGAIGFRESNQDIFVLNFSFDSKHCDRNGGAISVTESNQRINCCFISNTAIFQGASIFFSMNNQNISFIDSVFLYNGFSEESGSALLFKKSTKILPFTIAFSNTIMLIFWRSSFRKQC